MVTTRRTWFSSQRQSYSSLRRVLAGFLAAICLSGNSFLAIPPTSASKNGTEIKNNNFAVGFTYLDAGVPSVCSGVLISPYVVVSARHCAQNDAGVAGTDYELTPPGTSLEAAVNPSVRLPKVSKVVIPGPENYVPGSKGGDIAFFILDIPFEGAIALPVANNDQVLALNQASEIRGYGFGAVFETGASYSPRVRRYPLSWSGFVSATDSTVYELTDPVSSACRGDSGGPITQKLASGSEIIIGVLSGASDVQANCGTAGLDGLYRIRFTLIHPYLPLVSEYLTLKPPSPTKKIIKITCVKGSKKMIIKGVSPKCPKGYKKK